MRLTAVVGGVAVTARTTAAATGSSAERAADLIFGNFDVDRIDGGPGDDRINVVQGGHDVVICGPGSGGVFVDSGDAVARDCESVRR
jgi:hypothetical protein